MIESKTWITSDIHFYHINILKFCADTRPYSDISEMNDVIISQWNSLISPIDKVYILGDIAFTDATRAARIVNRCHGEKVLITGNHDRKLLKDAIFRGCFTEIHDYHYTTYKGTDLVMFHYPIWEWDQMHRGSVHFHGHLHGRPCGVDGRIMDVSMDGNRCMPYLLDNVLKEVLKKPVREHYSK